MNVRRLFLMIEESIDEGMQRVVFEPNDEPLGGRVRQPVTRFLFTQWRLGAPGRRRSTVGSDAPTRAMVLELPDELVECVAELAAELVLERLNGAPTESEFLTVAEAADLLCCQRQRVYDLCSAGQLERFKDGSRVLVGRADVVAHLLPSGSRNGMRRTVAR